MYKLWQWQIEAYQVLSKNVNSQKKKIKKEILTGAPNVLSQKTTKNMIHPDS